MYTLSYRSPILRFFSLLISKIFLCFIYCAKLRGTFSSGLLHNHGKRPLMGGSRKCCQSLVCKHSTPGPL